MNSKRIQSVVATLCLQILTHILVILIHRILLLGRTQRHRRHLVKVQMHPFQVLKGPRCQAHSHLCQVLIILL